MSAAFSTARRSATSPARVAHEVNNILTYAYSLLDLLGEEDRDARVRAGRGVRTSLQLVAGLLADLDEGDDRPLADQRACPEDIAAMALELGAPSLERATTHLEAEPGLPDVAMPPLRLLQVLLNLVINAGHALRGVGGGRLVVRVARRGERVQFAVEDEGGGVDPRLEARIFESGVTSDAGRGRGLGLPVCAELVRQARGQIWFERVARGTCFHVSLPVAT